MITTDLCIGCLDKYILGVGDSATDPAPLKLEKASRNSHLNLHYSILIKMYILKKAKYIY